MVAGRRRGTEVREFADIDLRMGGARFRAEGEQLPPVVFGDPYRAAADDRWPVRRTPLPATAA